ncbi:hypothetical protein K1719_040268 [Acacia pycnantha]|nr:hypothetical protein K1719_040268 [Acacia pycnantha]
MVNRREEIKEKGERERKRSTDLKDIGTKSGERKIMEENQNSTMPPSSSVATRPTSMSLDNVKTLREKSYDQLSTCGIFLDNKTKKFWVNKKLDCNCFMIYAKSLAIAWIEDSRYWEWRKLEESSGTRIEVAELKEVWWLDVCGKLDTRYLSPGVMYGVSFHVKLKKSGYYSWSVKVSLRLKGVKYQEHEMNSREMLKDKWMEVPVGQFVAPAHDVEARELEFRLWEHDGWKEGLIVKGASIKPL